MSDMRVCVIGLGYIGLPTAALLAANGYDVLGIDVDETVVKTINDGKIHIVEPDLDAFVHNAVLQGKLNASTRIETCDVYMICVPTPFYSDEATPRPNIDHVRAATRMIGPVAKAGDIVILESTSPVGTTRIVAEELQSFGIDTSSLSIAYCPERVLPGKIMTELVENDRVVGGLTPEAAEQAGSFYRSFVRGKVLITDAATAEMCKLTENSFRDVNIAFANELSRICDKEGIDVWKLISLANCHPRVNILQPGPGVGGHCIAVDPWFIVSRDPENSRLIRLARETNNDKTDWTIDRIKAAAAAIEARGEKPIIACMGLAFKPDIDDLRESPAAHIAETLTDQGYAVLAVEPHISAHRKLDLVPLEKAFAAANIFALLVKHRIFAEPNVLNELAGRDTIDFCGLLA